MFGFSCFVFFGAWLCIWVCTALWGAVGLVFVVFYFGVMDGVLCVSFCNVVLGWCR